ncbi:glycerol-3-phosphate transporter [Sansalvadorimonas sp. 2012CJ34-2]|uniref:Glycerol-3-phosphate transporter n=1 Tax=Parendozoicomonas callyspongiae TaxID=2942213 RepID=A0ABT0PCC2_9GAMM|nr:glycerol-3-phosphate transporter [Sansalvadorimonas sp. 2012CJ34-2]MCL6268994.1 glycerol-3-phosphate transporter [Sansalvadorimonas sp. 2012CJ34-2]
MAQGSSLSKKRLFSFLAPPAARQPVSSDQVDSTYRHLRLQVFLGIFIGYAAYYLVRKNFSMAMPDLIAQGFTKTELGFALSGAAISYGLSKFLMGTVSDRSDARRFLTLGLIVTAGLTIFMGLSPWALSSIPIMFTLLFLNGWFQGMGWPASGRVMVHWFSPSERGSRMAIWNLAHNVGGGLMGPLAILGITLTGAWQSAFYVPGLCAFFLAFVTYLLVRDTPQSCGLPPIENYRDDYHPDYNASHEQEFTLKEILFQHVLPNKTLWCIALANAFVYLVRYGVLDWAPTFLSEVKGFQVQQSGWAWFAYEVAAIPGTLFCGWLSDRVFQGRRAPANILFMILVMGVVFIYWLNPAGNPLVDNLALITIGFLIYGPVMLIGVQALDLVPKKAAGTAAGLTGLFGYLGGALMANIAMGFIVDNYGWDGGFMMLAASCLLAILFMSFSWTSERAE